MIRTGLERLIENSDDYKKNNIGLITNQTAVTSDLEYIWHALYRKGLNVKRVFSPEHGLFGTEQDQVPVEDQPEFNCDLVSLYGTSINSLVPDDSLLHDIDTVIFDIQDVGARYYTYVNTMVLFMKRIESKGIKLVVLDRPNPLGGISVEGPLLNEDYESFVGVLPLPVRHGMTAGEIALFTRDHFDLDADLVILKMSGWERGCFFNDTSLPWIPPSPNMPSLNTAIVYPGMCLFEGINISEGRGTTTPFENIGAPFVNAGELAGLMNSLDLDGVYFRPTCFKPTVNKYSGENAPGIFIHVLDRYSFNSFKAGIALVWALFHLYQEACFLHGVYEFNDSHPAFDLLTGSSRIREMIISGTALEDIFESWIDEENEFLRFKENYHLYRD